MADQILDTMPPDITQTGVFVLHGAHHSWFISFVRFRDGRWFDLVGQRGRLAHARMQTRVHELADMFDHLYWIDGVTWQWHRRLAPGARLVS